jgi:hypothetical protein
MTKPADLATQAPRSYVASTRFGLCIHDAAKRATRLLDRRLDASALTRWEGDGGTSEKASSIWSMRAAMSTIRAHSILRP